MQKKIKCMGCGKDLTLEDIAYLRGNGYALCKNCFPNYYVRNCRFLSRKIRGEKVLACHYCQYKEVCRKYIDSMIKEVKGV